MTLMDLETALNGSDAPPELLARMALLDIDFTNPAGQQDHGQIVVHELVADEVRRIFARIHESGFPIEQIVPICDFAWDDDASMAANNSSSFCYRRVAGTTQLSAHSKGAAIDINPLWNPFDSREGRKPQGALYDPSRAGTFSRQPGTLGSQVIGIFEEEGWFWLGGRLAYTDRHHFERIGARDAVL